MTSHFVVPAATSNFTDIWMKYRQTLARRRNSTASMPRERMFHKWRDAQEALVGNLRLIYASALSEVTNDALDVFDRLWRLRRDQSLVPMEDGQYVYHKPDAAQQLALFVPVDGYVPTKLEPNELLDRQIGLAARHLRRVYALNGDRPNVGWREVLHRYLVRMGWLIPRSNSAKAEATVTLAILSGCVYRPRRYAPGETALRKVYGAKAKTWYNRTFTRWLLSRLDPFGWAWRVFGYALVLIVDTLWPDRVFGPFLFAPYPSRPAMVRHWLRSVEGAATFRSRVKELTKGQGSPGRGGHWQRSRWLVDVSREKEVRM